MTARRTVLLVLSALLAVVALFPAYTAVRAAGYADYCAGRAAEPETPDLTVISDLPLLPGRDAYQEVLTEVADEYGVARADFAAAFTGDGRRLDVFSFLPPHLNDRGYGYWFDAFRPHIERIVVARS